MLGLSGPSTNPHIRAERGETLWAEPLCEGFELALPGHGDPLTTLDTDGTLIMETKRCVSSISEAEERQSSLPGSK